jgi:hypothetical protein
MVSAHSPVARSKGTSWRSATATPCSTRTSRTPSTGDASRVSGTHIPRRHFIHPPVTRYKAALRSPSIRRSQPAIWFQPAKMRLTTSRHSPRIGSPASHQPSAFALRARLNQVDSYRAHQLNSQQVNEFRLRLVFDQICCRRAVWHQWGTGTSVALRTREYQRDSSSLPLGRSDDWGRQTKRPPSTRGWASRRTGTNLSWSCAITRRAAPQRRRRAVPSHVQSLARPAPDRRRSTRE